MPKSKQKKAPRLGNANNRRTAAYWLEDDNLSVLAGLALQCRTLEELAEILHVHPTTVRGWRTKHEKIKEAIDIGREYADAVVVNATFGDAVHVDGQSRKLWWQYRIAPKEIALAGKLYGQAGQFAQEGVSVEDARDKLIQKLGVRYPTEEES